MSDPATTGSTTCDEILSAVRRRLHAIVDQWTATRREADTLAPATVKRFVEELSDPHCAPSPAAPAAASTEPAHGGLLRRAVGVRGLMEGYRLLRQIVLEQVAAELGREPRLSEILALNERFDRLLAAQTYAAEEAAIASLRAVSDAQSKYMSFLSHDLRGGLNGIVLMLEVMRRELEGRAELAESVEDLALMRKSVTDIVSVMERYSLAERLRRGQVQNNRRTVDLQTSIQGPLAEWKRQAGAKGVELKVEAPGGATLQSDPELINIVLQNLVENAIRNTQRGSVTIRAEQEEGGWRIWVIDSGTGMPQEKLETFLDPVRRADVREKGLGLIIAQYAARLLGGQVEGKSAIGAGTTVSFFVPNR